VDASRAARVDWNGDRGLQREHCDCARTLRRAIDLAGDSISTPQPAVNKERERMAEPECDEEVRYIDVVHP
jgi:hypothetical protein